MLTKTPRYITVEQKLNNDAPGSKFFVSAEDYVHGGGVSFETLSDLTAWLSKHDYRYTVGSRGKWRLP